MGKRQKKGISRRKFVGGSAAAGTMLAIGCKTIDQGSQTLDAGAPAPGPIVKARIHPGIGVARLGNSKADDGYFVGPEVATPPPVTAADVRDPSGAIKRQAARFRIYGYDANDNVVAELTPDNATIQWSVHLANRKAQGYRFAVALDLTETAGVSVPRRNASVTGADRAQLAIDPGPRTISGKNAAGSDYAFGSGTFMGTTVALGELRTDADGRLLVLGGHGVSGSPHNTAFVDMTSLATINATFNNSDGWYDDTADGPVTAAVAIGGQSLPVDAAWVIVTPPNFAPNVVGWRTLYDLLVEIYINAGMMPAPTTTSFSKDVLPILQRLSNLQWVNAGFAAGFGKGGACYDFDDPQLIAKLAARPDATGADPNASLRAGILNAFRKTANAGDKADWPWPAGGWPWIFGDTFGDDTMAHRNLLLTGLRLQHLQRWAAGDFTADWTSTPATPSSLSDVPLADQPAALDEAALHFCLADAFHPGCELTWPMRHVSIYAAPFRIKTRSDPTPDFGETLTQAVAQAPSGPLDAQGPGDLTKWMALPWQGDTAYCQSGYDLGDNKEPQPTTPNNNFDPYLSTFWPARVPNQVLMAADYATVMNTTLPRADRLKAFKTRVTWYHVLPYQGEDINQTMMSMVQSFGSMGVLEARPGIPDDPDFPPVMQVESLPPSQALGLADDDAREMARSDDPLRRAGWTSLQQLRNARMVRGFK